MNHLSRQAREGFVTHLEGVLVPLSDAIRVRLIELVDAATSTRDAQERRDAMLEFDQRRQDWRTGTAKAWRQALVPPSVTTRIRLESDRLELIGDDVLENKILSSRLAMAIQEKATWELNDLRTRMEHVDGEDLAAHDVLRAEAVAQLMVEQWSGSGLPRTSWVLVQDIIHQHMVERALAGYRWTNEFLVAQGVMRDIDLSARVRRGAAAPAAGQRAEDKALPAAAAGAVDGPGGGGASSTGGLSGGGGLRSGYGPAATRPGGAAGLSAPGDGRAGGALIGSAGADSSTRGGGVGSSRPGGDGSGGFDSGGAAVGGGGAAAGLAGGSSGGAATPGWSGGEPGASGRGAVGSRAGGPSTAGAEAGFLTASTPLARARMRASGVLGQLKRLLADKVGFDSSHLADPSPGLAAAMAQHQTQLQTQVQTEVHHAETMQEVVYDDVAVERVAVELRERSGELKKKAATSSEKATIEIVALMFQAILAEERIPAAVRVWFARLQMPVLRVALSEPEFFGTLQHPARQLIDRMGSCVMGFDAAAISGSALEIEIKRVVQVIEQYPETGRRVFQLVYDEFQKFLSKYLTEKNDTQRLVSVAQQVEQRETLAIQYTIELRRMLNDVPVRDEIRQFFFKVWAEVLALAAVKHGPQHAETVALKQAAADLLWAASAKPNKGERARVIQDLPRLLLILRRGMTLLGLEGPQQEAHIKAIGDTLADAFMSKTEAIPQEQIDALAKRLANLEDFVSDDPSEDLSLDADSIELMLGIDASMIEVVADGGSKPSDAMLAWATELQLGTWFTLDHNGKRAQVQYAWRSDRGQLHLFASTEGRSYLIQARRLAAYLQAMLLVPAEEEALTVRATRDALAKLDANPERLLA